MGRPESVRIFTLKIRTRVTGARRLNFQSHFIFKMCLLLVSHQRQYPDRHCAANSDTAITLLRQIFSFFSFPQSMSWNVLMFIILSGNVSGLCFKQNVPFVPKMFNELLDFVQKSEWWCAPDEQAMECRQFLMISSTFLPTVNTSGCPVHSVSIFLDASSISFRTCTQHRVGNTWTLEKSTNMASTSRCWLHIPSVKKRPENHTEDTEHAILFWLSFKNPSGTLPGTKCKTSRINLKFLLAAAIL